LALLLVTLFVLSTLISLAEADGDDESELVDDNSFFSASNLNSSTTAASWTLATQSWSMFNHSEPTNLGSGLIEAWNMKLNENLDERRMKFIF
jgi:hypothetical protein